MLMGAGGSASALAGGAGGVSPGGYRRRLPTPGDCSKKQRCRPGRRHTAAPAGPRGPRRPGRAPRSRSSAGRSARRKTSCSAPCAGLPRPPGVDRSRVGPAARAAGRFLPPPWWRASARADSPFPLPRGPGTVWAVSRGRAGSGFPVRGRSRRVVPVGPGPTASLTRGRVDPRPGWGASGRTWPGPLRRRPAGSPGAWGARCCWSWQMAWGYVLSAGVVRSAGARRGVVRPGPGPGWGVIKRPRSQRPPAGLPRSVIWFSLGTGRDMRWRVSIMMKRLSGQPLGRLLGGKFQVAQGLQHPQQGRAGVVLF